MRSGIVIAITLGLIIAAPASAEMFQFTIENVGVQPLTPVFVASHDASFDIFDAGAAASAELVAIAEGGDVGPMSTLAASSAGVLDYAAGAFIMPGESTTIMIQADPDHPCLSFAAMLPATNDAFIGLAAGDDALNLFHNAMPTTYDFTLSYLEVWDAGSEINTELAADVPALGGMGSPDEGGVITKPHAGILGVGDVPTDLDWWGLDVAHITVVPEPASVLLCLVGGLWNLRRRTA